MCNKGDLSTNCPSYMNRRRLDLQLQLHGHKKEKQLDIQCEITVMWTEEKRSQIYREGYKLHGQKKEKQLDIQCEVRVTWTEERRLARLTV